MFDLPSDWRTAKLGDAASPGRESFIDGDWIEAPYITDRGIRLIQTGNIGRGEFLDKPESRKFISHGSFRELGCKWVSAGDILVCRLADPIGRACEVPAELDKSVTSVDVTILRVDPDSFNWRYVLYWLNSDINLRQAEDLAAGSTRSRISRTNLGRLPLPRPPLWQQEKIAQILDTLDTQIRQTETLIAKLEQIKQGLLTDLLTRGIDKTSQLRPPPDQAPHLYKDSPLGRIPREWKTVEIAKLGEIVTGSTPPSADPGAWGLALPFVTPADIGENDLIRVAERAVSERGKRYVRQVPPGSTLVVCIGSTIGKIGFCTMHVATNQQINALVPRDEHDPYFVFQAVRRHVGQIMAWAGLQAVPIVNKSMFGRMLVPVPPSTEQAAVSERMRAVDNRMVQEAADLAKLRNQKAGLMNDLLTGRVHVTPLLNTAEQAAG